MKLCRGLIIEIRYYVFKKKSQNVLPLFQLFCIFPVKFFRGFAFSMTLTEANQEIYTVVINDEEQYSIWLTSKRVPDGWKEVGVKGSKELCLTHIKEVWKDMRPLSLRKKMAEREALFEKEKKTLLESPTVEPQISKTVHFLSQGNHPVTTLPVNKTTQELKEAIDRKMVHFSFTDTVGGTCLCLPLDMQKTSLAQANFAENTGSVHLEGVLVLDFIHVRCQVDIELETLSGNGKLIVLEQLSPFKSLLSKGLQ